MEKTAFYLKWRARMAGHARLDDRGAALITALVFLVLLTLLGVASLMTSGTEMLTSRNDRLNKLAVDHANAGVAMALAALDKNHVGINAYAGAISSTDKVKTWKVKFNGYSTTAGTYEEYDLGGGESGVNFVSTVAFRLEDSLHYRDMLPAPATGDSTDDEVVGYSVNCGYNKSVVDSYEKSWPVYTITSTGYVKSGTEMVAIARVVTEVTKDSINIQVDAPFETNGCLQLQGSPNFNSAAGRCADETGDVPVYSTRCDSTAVGGTPTVTGGTAVTDPARAIIDFEDRLGMTLEQLADIAQAEGHYYEETIPALWPPSAANLGSSDNPAIVYIKPDPADPEYIFNGGTHYGILIIDGDLRLAGNFVWTGLIYVTGDLDAGVGTATINGAVLIEGVGTSQAGGTFNLNYDCEALRNIASTAFNTKIINWRREYD